MELRQLRYFVAVAEEKHFSRAAERLHIAQPALSQQVRRLEHEMKVQLLERTTRSVELTDAGRVLLDEARRVLAGADRALAAVHEAADGTTGLLRMGFVSSAALRIVPTLVLALHQQWPRVRLDLQEGTTDVQLDRIRQGTLDVGLVREMVEGLGFAVRPITKEPLVLAVPDNHRLAPRKRVHIADLAGEQFVVFPRSRVSRLYDHIAALCHQAGVRFEIAQEAVQFPTILGLVAARTGVAIVPASLRALHLPGLTYLNLADKNAYSTVSIVSQPDRQSSPLVGHCFDIATGLSYVDPS
ncbi:MAG: LysR family transcriptional regulator [Nocardioidaceae bacterium]